MSVRDLDGKTPLERLALVGDQVRFSDSGLDELFLFEAKRRVMNEGIVSLNGKVYGVDALLVEETFTLR